MKISNKKQYARALVELGAEKGIVDKLLVNLQKLELDLTEDRALFAALHSSNLSLGDKRKKMESVYGDKMLSEAYNFVCLVVADGHFRDFSEILRAAEQFYLTSSGIVKVTVQSVIELSNVQEKALISILKDKVGKDIVVENTIQKDVLGGLVIKIGDTVVDCSLARKLHSLKQTIQDKK